ncbi:hypothetical protein C8N46_10953 [Kordia periserrulae]|uniref:Haem-binding uptake Tiki superfamily ChaN domain-containing protein n=1 Tax=Kordia periserrulae TaxID=701523 RepID=A0A2T6BTR0_9FLAO|nr:hypothetical protein [Kordia periserrulae]PTX59465.1 hypothetical protein C8N46_10953 [Kordia periserrulae]
MIYKQLDINSVKNKSSKLVSFLNHKLKSLATHSINIIFLGETHNNQIDQTVTRELLINPPVVTPNDTRIILERGLNQVYNVFSALTDQRTEPHLNLNRQERSDLIAKMVLTAIKQDDKKTIYIVCGEEHSKEIYESLDKQKIENSIFISKPSVV